MEGQDEKQYGLKGALVMDECFVSLVFYLQQSLK